MIRIHRATFKVWPILGIMLVYQFFLHLRTRFVDWPETVFFSWLTARGLVPYRDFFEVHNPGIYYVNAWLINFFGPSLSLFRWEVAVVMVFNTVLLFLLSKKCFGAFPGLIASFFFVLLEFQFYGNGIWYEQFVLPFMLVAANVLCGGHSQESEGSSRRRYLLAGLLLGLGALFKQQVLWSFLGVGLILCWEAVRKIQPVSKVVSRLVAFGLGFAAPLVVHLLYLVSQGGAKQYLHGALYVPVFDWHLYRLPGASYQMRFLFWGLLCVLFLRQSKQKNDRGHNPMSWLLAALFMSSLLFDFPTHGKLHLLLPVAFVCIFAGYLTFHLSRNNVWIGLLLVSLLIWTVTGHLRFLRHGWGEGFKMRDERYLPAALWVRENTEPNERIYAIVEEHMHFYVLSDRLPATYNAYLYSWVLKGKYGVESIVRDLEEVAPRLVLVGVEYLSPAARAQRDLDLILRYIDLRYEKAALLDQGVQVYIRRSG